MSFASEFREFAVKGSVVDLEGREVPDASNLLHFSVNGNYRIIGVGNGNPSSHEPDNYTEGGWQRHLFGGKCQVIIQIAGPSVDGINGASLTVTGEGLLPVTAEFPIVVP